MATHLRITDKAAGQLVAIMAEGAALHKKVVKTLASMETDLRHPGLQTHEFTSMQGPNGEKVFDAYVENKTPAACRIFWRYGPGRGVVTIVSISRHS